MPKAVSIYLRGTIGFLGLRCRVWGRALLQEGVDPTEDQELENYSSG